jgi:hypothetical protein
LAEEPIPYFRQYQTVDNAPRTSSVGFFDEMDLDVMHPNLKVWKSFVEAMGQHMVTE